MSDPTSTIAVRPLSDEDGDFLSRVVWRLNPGPTASPRDPAAMVRYFTTIESGIFSLEPGAEAFVAVVHGEAVGLVTLHPDTDHFTGHPRAHVDHLTVAAEAEGRGVGRALMAFAEQWAREKGCREVVLDVFATNTGAIAFYEQCGFRVDHLRMAKPIN
jgi:GNAT superfamily N-acetyltransferase